MRVLVLVDGEHYPPVTRWGIQAARSMGHEVVAALFLGGTEKVSGGEAPDLGVPTTTAGADRMAALADALDATRPDAVLDLSDEPILGYRERMELVAVALARGAPYLGPDFRFDPPMWGPPLPVPTLAVIGTGKRTGKTAIAGEAARVADAAGMRPVIVAMGRGGPAEPQVARAGSVTMESLLDLVRRGQHAASDYLEDALFTGVATVGARRSGGGLAGAPFATNVREAAQTAVDLGAGLVVLEGSGAAIPPIPWDAAVLVAPARIPEEYVAGYLGPFRILLSDLFVVTMNSGPSSGSEKLFALRSHVQRLNGDARFVVTDFQPVPLRDVRGRAVYFTTTAPEEVAARQVAHLESVHGCRVVGHSTHLADRRALGEDMDASPPYEVLLTELKAAAIDVATDRAVARGAEVVFVDNRAATVSDGPELAELMRETLDRAVRRHGERRDGAAPTAH